MVLVFDAVGFEELFQSPATESTRLGVDLDVHCHCACLLRGVLGVSYHAGGGMGRGGRGGGGVCFGYNWAKYPAIAGREGAMTTRPAMEPSVEIPQGAQQAKVEPLPDPKRKPDAMRQFPDVSRAYLILERHFSSRPDVLVGSEGYLCLHSRDRSDYVVPDCVVAFGVNPGAIRDDRNGYVISEVGKPPEFVLEVASESTGELDYRVKPGIYAGFGVAEYWRFDRTGGGMHDAPLGGGRLVAGAYQPIELTTGADGVIWGRSEVLGLDLCWDRGRLRFYDPVAGGYLPDLAEAMEQRDAAEARAEAAESELRLLRGDGQ